MTHWRPHHAVRSHHACRACAHGLVTPQRAWAGREAWGLAKPFVGCGAAEAGCPHQLQCTWGAGARASRQLPCLQCRWSAGTRTSRQLRRLQQRAAHARMRGRLRGTPPPTWRPHPRPHPHPHPHRRPHHARRAHHACSACAHGLITPQRAWAGREAGWGLVPPAAARRCPGVARTDLVACLGWGGSPFPAPQSRLALPPHQTPCSSYAHWPVVGEGGGIVGPLAAHAPATRCMAGDAARPGPPGAASRAARPAGAHLVLVPRVVLLPNGWAVVCEVRVTVVAVIPGHGA